MFFPKTLENYHFEHKYQILEKEHFWTHETLGSYNILVWKYVEKISKNFTI